MLRAIPLKADGAKIKRSCLKIPHICLGRTPRGPTLLSWSSFTDIHGHTFTTVLSRPPEILVSKLFGEMIDAVKITGRPPIVKAPRYFCKYLSFGTSDLLDYYFITSLAGSAIA